MRAFLACIVLSAAANAQTPLSLSLKRAVEIAVAPDGATRLALAEEAIEQAEHRLEQTKAAFLPNLDTTIAERRQTTNLRAFGFSFDLPVPGFSLPSLVGPFSVFDARTTAQQSVVNFADIKRFRASKANLAAVKSDAVTSKNQVSEEVSRNYLAGLRAEAARATARANVELSEALLKLAQQEKNAGTGTGIDVTRAGVQLSNDRLRLIRAQNDEDRAVLILLKSMGVALDSPVELSTKLDDHPTEAPSVADLLAKARSSRPELKTQQQREESLRLTQLAVKDERLPTLGAAADYGAIGPDVAGSRGTYTLGVQMKVPMFDGFRRQARRQEAFSVLRQEQVRTRELNQQIELQVRLALELLRSGSAEVEAAMNGITIAETELAQARRRYQAGVSTSLEITDAQTRLQRARDNRLIALYDYNLARLDLAAATGSIMEYVNQ